MKKFRTAEEMSVGADTAKVFEKCPDSVEVKLENFPKYVRRQHLKRFLAQYEIFKKVMPVKGSIVECGVFRGFGLMSWAKLSTMLEPENFMRRVYGFDTFEGFTASAITDKDQNKVAAPTDKALCANSYDELQELIGLYDRDRFLNHMDKVTLVRGNACETIPRFIKENPHVVVSLLFLDFDLYEPTKVALETFLPRMPKGAIVCFDELDNPQWPGETLAAIENVGLNKLRLQRVEFDPYIAFAQIE